MCFLPSLFWMSKSLEVPAGVTQEFSSTFLLPVLALIFLVRIIQSFLSLVDREVEFLRTNDLIVLHLLGIYFILFIYLVGKKKNPRYRDSNSRPNASEGYKPNELPGKKNERKITTEKKKRKKEKTLDGC